MEIYSNAAVVFLWCVSSGNRGLAYDQSQMIMIFIFKKVDFFSHSSKSSGLNGRFHRLLITNHKHCLAYLNDFERFEVEIAHRLPLR